MRKIQRFNFIFLNFPTLHTSHFTLLTPQTSRNQQRGIAIAEETKIVVEGVLVDASPIASDEGTDEQQQRRLGLMEIGDEVTDDFVLVARHDDDLRGRGERVELMAVEPVENRAKRVES